MRTNIFVSDWYAVNSSTLSIERSEGEFLEIGIDEDTTQVDLYFATSASGSAFIKMSDLSTTPSIEMPSGCDGATFQWPDLLTSSNGTKTLAVYLFDSGIRIHCNDILVSSLFFKELGSSCGSSFDSIITSNDTWSATFDTSTTSQSTRYRKNRATKRAVAELEQSNFLARGSYHCFTETYNEYGNDLVSSLVITRDIVQSEVSVISALQSLKFFNLRLMRMTDNPIFR